MTPGRTWGPIDTLKLNHQYMVPDRFEPLRNGHIELIGNGYHGAGGRALHSLVWQDSCWLDNRAQALEGYTVYPVISHPDRQWMVWKSTAPLDSAYHYFSYIVTADVIGDSVTPPDTVVRMDAASFAYRGTSWNGRRWVAVCDGQGAAQPLPMRVFRSDTVFHWAQMRTGSITGINGLAIAALDSSSALVVGCDWPEGMRWGILRDTSWVQEPDPLEPGLWSEPRLARRPGGSLLLAWTTAQRNIFLREYRDGAWSSRDTIQALYPEPAPYLFMDPAFSQEVSEYPATAWFGYGSGSDFAYYIWVAFPTDSGFGVGERIPGSWEGVEPSVVRDENEDVWVAWWRFYDGIYWTHSHSTENSSVPVIDEESLRPRLHWTLSGPAPGTWWGVMRSADGAPPERVGRVRAGPGTEMSWADSSAPAAASLRYAVRRECRDVRYQVTSAFAEWRARGAKLLLARRSANPATDAIELEVSGANAGSVEVLLYDLQGRTVSSERMSTTGSGVDALRVPLSQRVRSGLYFLRVRGSDGRLSRGLKVAVLR